MIIYRKVRGGDNMKFKCELSSELFRVDKCSLWDDIWGNLYKVKKYQNRKKSIINLNLMTQKIKRLRKKIFLI